MTDNKTLGLSFVVAPLTFIPIAYANPAADVKIDERVVVTATQTEQNWLTTPASVTRIDRQQQLPSLNIDAGDALRGIPGIQADNRFNYAQDTRIVIRGFGARAAFGVRGLQLNVDGIPLSMPDGQAQTSSILLDDIGSAEVLRGPLAVLYGNTGGGVVEWQSQRPELSEVELATQQAGNSLSRYSAKLQYAGESQQVKLLATDFSTDGPRRHNSAEREQQALRWYSQLTDKQRLVIRYDNNDAPLLQDPSALTPDAWRQDPTQTVQRAVDFNTRKSILHRQGSISWIYDATEADYQVSAWQGDRDIQQFLPFTGDDATSSGAVIDLSRQFEGIHAQGQWQFIPNATLAAGWMLERQQDHRQGYVNNGGIAGELRRDEFNTIDSRSGYLRVDWQATNKLQLNGGVRYNQLDYAVDDYYQTPQNPDDSGNRDFSETSFAAGASYSITERIVTYLSYGEGFATPTLTEMAYRNEGSGLNNSLGPATNQQWEAGIKLTPWANWRAELSVFDIRSDNDILVDQSNDGRTTYRNAGKTQRNGIEAALHGQLLDNLTAYFSYTRLSAEFDSGALAGNDLPGVADSQWFARFNWQLPQQWRLQLSATHQGSAYTADDNAIASPSYTLVDAAVRKQWNLGSHQLNTWLAVNNITDEDYVTAVVVNQGSGRSFEPGVGREVSVGLSWRRRF